MEQGSEAQKGEMKRPIPASFQCKSPAYWKCSWNRGDHKAWRRTGPRRSKRRWRSTYSRNKEWMSLKRNRWIETWSKIILNSKAFELHFAYPPYMTPLAPPSRFEMPQISATLFLYAFNSLFSAAKMRTQRIFERRSVANWKGYNINQKNTEKNQLHLICATDGFLHLHCVFSLKFAELVKWADNDRDQNAAHQHGEMRGSIDL